MVATPLANPAGARRFVALDSLRGIAATGVVVTHFFEVWGGGGRPPILVEGHALVDLFFVLSGFVILASYGDKLRGGFPLGRFMMLRLGRIYPLHFAALAVMSGWLVLNAIATGAALDGVAFMRALFLLDGLGPYRPNDFAPVSWSLSVELVLYALCALLLRLRTAGVVLAGLVWLLAAVLMLAGWDGPVLGEMLQRGLVCFGLGALVQQLYRRSDFALSAGIATVIEALLLAVIMIELSVSGDVLGHRIVLHLLFAVLVFVMAHDVGLVSRLLHRRPFVFMGLVSFSIYLVHPLVFVGVSLADRIAARLLDVNFGALAEQGGPAQLALLGAVLIVTLALSYVTYRLIEAPARDWSRRRAARLGAEAAERRAPTI